ncbi:uncharacterized protein EV422DRAFT_610791 [Fimicolochytrium jonesii]|uniref:uncharacterized protein n=1 Tax=Fimicolochytrium jonesii TaxID=1396493 RepID=UPI0022FDEA93|nr:uncharacterized protein EV422DRAFT_610791 [Fimicolochytrium jonesii]KAI8815842.1 hypothetical protein EV422DRAFT_610791 [Fimicolochytrium jonesii]
MHPQMTYLLQLLDETGTAIPPNPASSEPTSALRASHHIDSHHPGSKFSVLVKPVRVPIPFGTQAISRNLFPTSPQTETLSTPPSTPTQAPATPQIGSHRCLQVFHNKILIHSRIIPSPPMSKATLAERRTANQPIRFSADGVRFGEAGVVKVEIWNVIVFKRMACNNDTEALGDGKKSMVLCRRIGGDPIFVGSVKYGEGTVGEPAHTRPAGHPTTPTSTPTSTPLPHRPPALLPTFHIPLPPTTPPYHTPPTHRIHLPAPVPSPHRAVPDLSEPPHPFRVAAAAYPLSPPLVNSPIRPNDMEKPCGHCSKTLALCAELQVTVGMLQKEIGRITGTNLKRKWGVDVESEARPAGKRRE